MTETTLDPALVTLLRYYDALERWDFEQGLSCFSDPCEYRHPPFAYGGSDDTEWTEASTGFVLARTRDELRGIWEAMRAAGLVDPHFEITGFARNGDVCFCEGFGGTSENPRTASWVAIFTVDDDHRITKYLPYRNVPPLPILGGERSFTL